MLSWIEGRYRITTSSKPVFSTSSTASCCPLAVMAFRSSFMETSVAASSPAFDLSVHISSSNAFEAESSLPVALIQGPRTNPMEWTFNILSSRPVSWIRASSPILLPSFKWFRQYFTSERFSGHKGITSPTVANPARTRSSLISSSSSAVFTRFKRPITTLYARYAPQISRLGYVFSLRFWSTTASAFGKTSGISWWSVTITSIP